MAGCCVWFGRNLVAFGNPVPALHLGVGQLALPAARLPPSSSVADLLSVGGGWGHVILPGLEWAFTPIWAPLLGLAFIGAVASATFGPTGIDRTFGLVALISAVAYLFTPRTADGYGAFFQFNTRFLAPALLIGLILFVRDPRVRRPFQQRWLLVLAAAAILIDVNQGQSFDSTSAWVGLLSGAFAFLAWAIRRLASRSKFLANSGLVVKTSVIASCGLAIGIGAWPAERSYLATRYTQNCELSSCAPFLFAESLRRARIAVAGGLGPYPLYGRDLSNTVVDLEHHGDHGTSTPVGTCRAWRAALVRGRYEYVFISPALYLWPRSTSRNETTWTSSDPGAAEISTTPTLGGDISVFRIRGTLHPSTCP